MIILTKLNDNDFYFYLYDYNALNNRTISLNTGYNVSRWFYFTSRVVNKKSQLMYSSVCSLKYIMPHQTSIYNLSLSISLLAKN